MLQRLMVGVLIAFLFYPFLSVFAAQVTTTMTWVVPNNKNFTLTYGSTCSATAFFFVESIAMDDPDADGNGTRILPAISRSGTDSNCQSATVAGMIITNTGNTSYNIDANFASALDTNVWLKVWRMSGEPDCDPTCRCGTTNAFAGWSIRCPVVSTTSPVTSTTCKDFNSSNSTIASRLLDSVETSGTRRLCFSGDLLAEVNGQAATVSQGDHNGSFQISSEVS